MFTGIVEELARVDAVEERPEGRRIRAGLAVIVVDDADRENEGDIVFAAEKATPELVNFAVTYARGILCAPVSPEIADQLGLKLLVANNTSKFGTPFTESIDAKRGTSTGTSAFDRARTLRAIAGPRAKSDDFVRPGHVFPLRAVPGGVLRRAGHTEAAPDLCRLAGLRPAAAVCEILADDGRMMRLPELQRFAKRHGLGVLTIRDLIAWRRQREQLCRRPRASSSCIFTRACSRATTTWRSSRAGRRPASPRWCASTRSA